MDKREFPKKPVKFKPRTIRKSDAVQPSPHVHSTDDPSLAFHTAFEGAKGQKQIWTRDKLAKTSLQGLKDALKTGEAQLVILSQHQADQLIATDLKSAGHAVVIRSESFEDVPSDPEIKLSAIVDRATAVIGDRQEAMRWLGTPVRGLDYATPISLLGTDEGTTRVNDILGQIEHGVW
jgi:putative toxin-antitoxin system antitoxin component (TIGR02293 family)